MVITRFSPASYHQRVVKVLHPDFLVSSSFTHIPPVQKSCLQNHFTAETQAHVWLRLRNHGRRNLITAIKQEKDKHRRPLMPGHLKCLRSVNIFAHKALWWWPRLLWHGSGRLCKHSQFNLPLQNAERVSIGAVRYLFKAFFLTGPMPYLGPLWPRGVRQLRRSVSEQRALPGPSLLSRSHGAAFDVKWNIMSGETSISSYHCGCQWLGWGGASMPEPLGERRLPTK